MHIIQEKWSDILNMIKIEHDVSDVSYSAWLEPLKVYKVEGNVVTIIVTNGSMALSYINKKYILPLKVAIAETTGEDYEISLVLPEEIKEEVVQPPAASAAAPVSLNENIEKANLNPRYTFDTFVVGNNNKMAHAASVAVAESPGEAYNPLFIYGGVGLGKTHLMHSIAHFVLQKNPSAKVLYVTSEYFTNELIDSIRNGNNSTMSKFREKYRNIDVLLIDDIQFIIGKESTQEELDGYKIDDEVIEYIAKNVKSNIRELEGSLNKIMAYANLEQKEINLDLAEKVLKDIISPNQKRIITPELILDIVAEHFDLSASDLIGNKRNSKIVFPRQIAMYLCRHMTEVTLKNIGKVLGGRDHTTVMNGITKIENELETSESTREVIDILKKKINPAK